MLNTLKRQFSFIDKEGIRARIEAEIIKRNGYFEFTASATYKESAGQCLDRIKPATDKQKEFIDLWKKYHLKDVSKIHNFKDNLEGIISVIEHEHEEAVNNKNKDLQGLMEEEGIDDSQKEACQSYLDLGFEDLEDFNEAYHGQYDNDADFVEELLTSCEDIPDNLPPYIYIDWERTAGQVMMDYSENNGHYFRNL